MDALPDSMSSRAASPGRSRSTLGPPHGSQVRSWDSLTVATVVSHAGGSTVKAFAHGVGGAQDLPLPLPFALAGGAAALALSFIVLTLAWRRPRFDAATAGRPLPPAVDRAFSG